jgi:hypothetical protein
MSNHYSAANLGPTGLKPHPDLLPDFPFLGVPNT